MRRYSTAMIVLLVIASLWYVFARQGDTVGAARTGSAAVYERQPLSAEEVAGLDGRMSLPIGGELDGRDTEGEAASLAALSREAAVRSNAAAAAQQVP